MRCFDVTLRGYDGDTDTTDHLVKWVLAPDLDTLKRWLSKMGMRLHSDPYDMGDYAAQYDWADGIDLKLFENGTFEFNEGQSANRWYRESAVDC